MSSPFSRSFLAQSVNSRIVSSMGSMAWHMSKTNKLLNFCLRLEENLYHKSLYLSGRDEDETRIILPPSLLKTPFSKTTFFFPSRLLPRFNSSNETNRFDEPECSTWELKVQMKCFFYCRI